MKIDTRFIVLDCSASLLKTLASDVMTFGALLACIYVSRDNLVWSAVTAAMLAVALAAKIIASAAKRRHTFSSKAALLQWANELPDDGRGAHVVHPAPASNRLQRRHARQ